MQRIVFDIGMYDGADTEYYLSKGFSVVAVEANPELIDRARRKFRDAVDSKRLILENIAISENRGHVELHLSGDDPGSSTLYQSRLKGHGGVASVSVEAVPFSHVLEKYGIPFYLKVDIEGADRSCILSLNEQARPSYVSFEMGDDAIELVEHLHRLGYGGFKIISQVTFKQLRQHGALLYRLARKYRHIFRRPEPEYLVWEGRSFKFRHSSGPMAEATSSSWQDFASVISDWRRFQEERIPDVGGWFDLHARLR